MSSLPAFAGSEGYGAYDDVGIGERPNKQENVRPRESGSRAIFRKCIYTCIACRFLRYRGSIPINHLRRLTLFKLYC